MRGRNSHFGWYSVNAADGPLTFHIDYASFPNWESTEQKRTITLVRDELTYTVPTPTAGGTAAGGEVKWKRAR